MAGSSLTNTVPFVLRKKAGAESQGISGNDVSGHISEHDDRGWAKAPYAASKARTDRRDVSFGDGNDIGAGAMFSPVPKCISTIRTSCFFDFLC